MKLRSKHRSDGHCGFVQVFACGDIFIATSTFYQSVITKPSCLGEYQVCYEGHGHLLSMLHNPKYKPVVFMLSAALGCLAAAILAEAFLFLLPKGESKPPAQSICLTIDISGSMAGKNLQDMKDAAKQFIDKRSGDDLALAIFSSDARLLVPFTNDTEILNTNIDSLNAYGGTNFERALEVSAQALKREEKTQRNSALLIFTDGDNTEGNANRAIEIAKQLREQDVRIFAVAAVDADVKYLTRLTGDRSHVISAKVGQFGDAFDQAEKMIASTIGSSSSSYRVVFLGTAGWTVFIALGIALALVAIQNFYLKKRLLPKDQVTWVAIGAILAGIAAGIVAQTATSALSVIHISEKPSSIPAWSVLGGLLAFGMVFVIPNLDKKKALYFGALGGFLGCIGYLVMTANMGNAGGRLIGAFILGACIGLLVAIVETVYRKVWLMVIYDPRNFTQVNLGLQAVTVGSGKNDTVPVSDVGEKAATFLVVGDSVRFTDANGTQSLEPGNRVMVGKVELVVCSKDVPFSPSKFYPMKMSRARELKNKQ